MIPQNIEERDRVNPILTRNQRAIPETPDLLSIRAFVTWSSENRRAISYTTHTHKRGAKAKLSHIEGAMLIDGVACTALTISPSSIDTIFNEDWVHTYSYNVGLIATTKILC